MTDRVEIEFPGINLIVDIKKLDLHLYVLYITGLIINFILMSNYDESFVRLSCSPNKIYSSTVFKNVNRV